MERSIKTPHAPAAIGPYAQAVRTADRLFLSGQIALDPTTGELIPGGVGAQTRRVLQNLEAVLAAGGSDLRRVLKTTVYLTDMGTFAEMNAVYATYFPQSPPARSTIGVAALPRGALVEIDAIAEV